MTDFATGSEAVDSAVAAQRGRDLRAVLRRRDHASVTLPADRDPVGIVLAQNETRLRDLTPVRMGRMAQSPFTWYRGTAAVMAADLAADAVTGVEVVSCGDAHISNFGLFASPERRLMFDLNDFDEASVAPWEWDLKRLAASVVVGARDIGLSDDDAADAARLAVGDYRAALSTLYEGTVLDRYYFQVDTDLINATAGGSEQKAWQRAASKARKRTSDQVLSKIVSTDVDGVPRIVDQPPVTRHVQHATPDEFAVLFERYRNTLRPDTALLLSQFRLVDYVLRVVGVGSVGTRCYMLLFEGPSGEPLVLQVKEAPPSVLETHGGRPCRLPGAITMPDSGHQGFRVVACQRILQAQSDPFLGWIEGFAGDDDNHRRVDYYWRQFRDMKGAVDTAKLSGKQFTKYAGLCARLLARAHSQSPNGAVAAGYLGDSERFDDAVARWSVTYADQVERDFEAFTEAVRSGRVAAEAGV